MWMVFFSFSIISGLHEGEDDVIIDIIKLSEIPFIRIFFLP